MPRSVSRRFHASPPGGRSSGRPSAIGARSRPAHTRRRAGRGLRPASAAASRTAACTSRAGRRQELAVLRRAARLRHGLLDRQAADAEVGDPQPPFAARPRRHQDVGRLEVPMHDRRIHAVGEADDLRQASGRRWRHGRRQPAAGRPWITPARSPPSTYSYSRHGGSALEVRMQQRHDAFVLALLHDLVDDGGLVLEQAPSRPGRGRTSAPPGPAVEVRVGAFQTSPKPPTPSNSTSSQSTPGNGRSPALKRGRPPAAAEQGRRACGTRSRPRRSCPRVAGRRRLRRRIIGGTWPR